MGRPSIRRGRQAILERDECPSTSGQNPPPTPSHEGTSEGLESPGTAILRGASRRDRSGTALEATHGIVQERSGANEFRVMLADPR
jgi:hypothetical protein